MSNVPIVYRDLWRTPNYLFAWANKEFGPFDIDLAATAKDSKCDKYYTEEDDALQQTWHGDDFRGWLNPPYSKIHPWVEKAIVEADHGFRTAMLIPTFNGEPRDKLIVDNATEVVLIEGRVQFKGAHLDVKPSSNPRGSMLVYFGEYYLNRGCTFRSVKRKDMEAEYVKSNA